MSTTVCCRFYIVHSPIKPTRRNKKTTRGTTAGKNKIKTRIAFNTMSTRVDPPPRPASILERVPFTNNSNSFSETTLIKIVHLNCQSCRNKCNEIRDMILEYEIDILFLTETWLQVNGDEAIIADIVPSNYTIQSFPRIGRRGGGIALIFKEALTQNITVQPRRTFNHKTYESIELTATFGDQFYNLICLYRPPSTSKSAFNDDFETLLFHFTVKAGHCVMIGDFNFNFTNNLKMKKINETITHCDMTQHITIPTHRSGRILDWVITRNDFTSDILSTDVWNMDISDHKPILLQFNTSKVNSEPTQRTFTSRDINAISFESFKNDIIDTLRQTQPTTVDQLNKALEDILNKHAPLVTRNVSGRPFAPWYSLDVRNAKAAYRQAERKWYRTGLAGDRVIMRIRRKAWMTTMKQAKKASNMSSSTMPKEAREEIRRLSNKNAALERQNTELRMKNAEMKRHNAALQIKVSKFDKKVDKVVDRVVKEMRTLQNPDDTEEGDTATPKGPPQKKPRPDPQSTTCPSTSAGGDSITASDQDRGLDSIIAAISRSAQKNPSGREDQEKKFTLGASLGTQDDAAGDASRGADRKLLDMMKTFLESTQPKKFNPTL